MSEAASKNVQRNPKTIAPPHELFWEVGSARPTAHLTIAGVAQLVDNVAMKQRVWHGKIFDYRLSEFWPGGPEASDFGLMFITPNRVELGWQPAMWQGHKPQVWTPRPLVPPRSAS